MKISNSFILTIVLMVSTIASIAQNKTEYHTQFIDGSVDVLANPSSTYWNGHNYTFFSGEHIITCGVYDIDGDNHVEKKWRFDMSHLHDYIIYNVSSCIFNDSLYTFWYYNDGTEAQTEINYSTFEYSGDGWNTKYSLTLNSTITQQMAAINYNDTLYTFFIDDADKYVKYYRLVIDESSNELEVIDNTPFILQDDYRATGNVAAIHITDDNLESKLLVSHPTEPEKNRDRNYVGVYSGTPGNFYLTAHKVNTISTIPYIAMAQGSVKGGTTKTNMVQFSYTDNNTNENHSRCELNLSDSTFTNWESLDRTSCDMLGKYVWLMELYTKNETKRQKYLAQGHQSGGGAAANLWVSDVLEYEKSVTEIVPKNMGASFYDLITVVEGAPPYTTQGYTLDECATSEPKKIPSTFKFTKEEEHSLETTSEYSFEAKSSQGFGPLKTGWGASFQTENGSSTTETISITNTITPPPVDHNKTGFMHYYFIAPHVTRDQWVAKDYNGDIIEPARHLFFFEFHSPYLQHEAIDLSLYGSNTPREDSLETYMSRNFGSISSIEEVALESGDLDFLSNSIPSFSIDFEHEITEEHSKSFSVSLGVEAEVEIFSASAEIKDEIKYSLTSTAKYSNGFDIEWESIYPKDTADPGNIKSYTVDAYVFKTKNSSAYYLLDGFKDTKPFFIAYQISELERDGWGLYSIDEKEFITKYDFSTFPNPANEKSIFSLKLNQDSKVRIEMYNSQGVMVKTIINQTMTNGTHHLDTNTSILKPGIYYYRAIINEDQLGGKLVISR